MIITALYVISNIFTIYKLMSLCAAAAMVHELVLIVFELAAPSSYKDIFADSYG